MKKIAQKKKGDRMESINLLYIFMFFVGLFLVLIFLVLQYRRGKELNYYPKPKRYPILSMIVPAYNEEESIANTLNSLLKLKYPKGKKEIIVVNDGSKDKTAEIVKKFMAKHKEIRLLDKQNSGKADSVNQAIKIAKGELMAITDADSYPNPDAAEKMVGYFEDLDVAAVTSRVLVKNDHGWLSNFQIYDYAIIAWTRKLLDFLDAVYVTNGPLSIYRTAIVRKLGGFDKKNLTEDIEITWNILSHGYKTRMSYSAVVYTTVPEKFKTWVNQRIRWNLGGLQTLYKYKKDTFRNGEHVLGHLIIPYVSSAFIFALIGFFLSLRYFWIKGWYYFYSIYYSLQQYNMFKYLDYNFNLTFIFLLASLFFVVSMWYYKIGFRTSQVKDKSLLKILLFVFIYRPLYLIPLILTLYKLIKGDIGWYTK